MPICVATITGSCQVLFSFSTSVHLECFAGPKDPEEKDLLLQKLWLWIFLHKIFKIINLYKQDSVILVTVTARSFEGSINLAKREKITHRQTEQLLRFPQVLKGGTLSSSKQLRDTLFDSWMKSSGHFEYSSWAFVMTERLVLSLLLLVKHAATGLLNAWHPLKYAVTLLWIVFQLRPVHRVLGGAYLSLRNFSSPE